MARLTVLLLALMMATCSWAGAQSSPGVDGVWTGAGVQDNRSTWSIRLALDTANDTYRIDYPSLKCGGRLQLLRLSAHRLEFTEELTYGLSRCVNGGKLIITQTGADELSYEWYYPNGKKGAVGILKRAEK